MTITGNLNGRGMRNISQASNHNKHDIVKKSTATTTSTNDAAGGSITVKEAEKEFRYTGKRKCSKLKMKRPTTVEATIPTDVVQKSHESAAADNNVAAQPQIINTECGSDSIEMMRKDDVIMADSPLIINPIVNTSKPITSSPIIRSNLKSSFKSLDEHFGWLNLTPITDIDGSNNDGQETNKATNYPVMAKTNTRISTPYVKISTSSTTATKKRKKRKRITLPSIQRKQKSSKVVKVHGSISRNLKAWKKRKLTNTNNNSSRGLPSYAVDRITNTGTIKPSVVPVHDGTVVDGNEVQDTTFNKKLKNIVAEHGCVPLCILVQNHAD
jgi:hypothetical protein